MGMIERVTEALAIAMYHRGRVEAYASGRHAWSVIAPSNTAECLEPEAAQRAAA